MKLDRRTLLTATSMTAIAGALSPASVSAAPPESLRDWPSVRRLFDLAPEYTHLALFLLSSHPRPVRQAIDEYRKKLDANPALTVEHAMFETDSSLPDRAAKSIAGYLSAKPGEIALTGNTTTGLALIYHGLPLRPQDEVLTTSHDHYSHHEAIRLATERAGASYRKIDLFDDFARISADEIVDRIKRAIAPKTRVVGVTWVHSASGLKLPIRRIADAIAEANRGRSARDRVLLVVDGVHGIGVEDPNVPAMGCDAFAAGAHKWILGPRGTGFVWAKPEVWKEMRPLIPSFTAFDLFEAWTNGKAPAGPPQSQWFSPGGFHAYEHYWATPTAIELHTTIGPAKITERIHALNQSLKQGLAKMRRVKLYTPLSVELSAGMVVFDVDGLSARQVVSKLLAQKIIGSTTPYRSSYARLSCGIYNDEADVERALTAVRGMA